MAPSTPDQMLNTSWTLHRLSPLHHGKEFQSLLDNPEALKTYANRLHDQLTGNVLAGFQVGTSAPSTEGDTLSRTGALINCIWEAISSLSLADPDASHPESPCGILVVLEYEKITYKAVLLAPPEGSHSRKTSTYLPLLLTRLPGPLRQIFISFLSANFDTYCSIFRLPSQFLCSGLASYVDALTQGRNREPATSRAILEDVVKEIQITMSFSSNVTPALRSLNINIPRGSIKSFLPASGVSNQPGGSILSGLSSYIEKHLAMNLDLAGSSARDSPASKHVRISKIACNGFVLGAEGKMKLVAQPIQTGSAGDDSAENDDDARNEKKRLALRASEVLLLSVIQRSLVGENQES
ncbi:kinetochore complex Sim4 subunit Fta1-domain-containing protein [Aspergillus pseudotamarii]|uniref:Kinetochore complex Sim4 subunit Fta1-domain-containing protein n=1 Tax=Aspergillus pseudotamarii TaxID=132259 RepID=A0A5N6SXG4_ASPPS|nr:kinetochore complex Sim4 subunit Fta1-domain-containing protein [Aspergillus pseudotamarii]KAE8138489.1 kinetochore complex Sim4 subunit Fta1-domain-containing protein [Aspergillus pseudotamarii]